MMCKLLTISKSSYYNHLSGKYQKLKQRKNIMENNIKTIYFENKQRYGSPRIAAELRANGIAVSNTTVAKYMHSMNLCSKLSKKHLVTTNSKHNKKVFDNLLDRQFNVKEPSRVWVSDITYIQTSEGFIYHTIVMDLFDRKVIGWANSNGITTEETVIPAFNMAVKNRFLNKGLIFHSDRGVQYASQAFINLLSPYKIIQSMSRKGNCWDNACAESFFKTLKTELIYGNKLITKEQMKTILFEYIEIYYNQKRRHSALNNQTISEFLEKYYNKVA